MNSLEQRLDEVEGLHEDRVGYRANKDFLRRRRQVHCHSRITSIPAFFRAGRDKVRGSYEDKFEIGGYDDGCAQFLGSAAAVVQLTGAAVLPRGTLGSITLSSSECGTQNAGTYND